MPHTSQRLDHPIEVLFIGAPPCPGIQLHPHRGTQEQPPLIRFAQHRHAQYHIRLFSRCASCDTLPVTYAMMHAPMSTEAEHQGREDTRWTLSRWWIKRLRCCASEAA